MKCLGILFLAFTAYGSEETNAANPIRKVVNMLQLMQKKVAADGVKEKELCDKFQCWATTGKSELTASITAAEEKAPRLAAEIKKAVSDKEVAAGILAEAKAERKETKAAIATATAIREKEAKAFAAKNTDQNSNAEAARAAIKQLEAGAAGAFLQSAGAQKMRQVVANADVSEEDRSQLVAFLSSDARYSPAGGQVIGILKQMVDEMDAANQALIDAEKAAIAAFEELMASKKKLLGVLQKRIEKKLKEVADLGVKIAQLGNEHEDVLEALTEDKKFLAGVDEASKKKKAECQERAKTRAEELTALADTIKVLNDDDALELFKKTLPSPPTFLEVSQKRERALKFLKGVPSLDFISLALKGNKFGLDKVIKMIDDMVAVLAEEQAADDTKKKECGDLKLELAREHTDLSNAQEDLVAAADKNEKDRASLRQTIADLTKAIKDLDAAVAEATENRKEEAAEFKQLIAQDTAAKELLKFAKNRLNKFYNPKLYKPPAKREISEAERAELAAGGTLAPTEAPAGIAGTGISVGLLEKKPAPPPKTFEGAYQKKGEESNGVIAMIDLLVKDVEKEMTEATQEEKNAQEDYATFTKESAAKRDEDSTALDNAKAGLADAQTQAEEIAQDTNENAKSLDSNAQKTAAMHGDCDWLVKFYDLRKQSRADETDALKNAKAVLSGADFS